MADIRAQLFYGGVWHDVPLSTRSGVTITPGRTDPTADPAASSARFTVDNISGQFNPVNPMSPLYGRVGRNTPVRLIVGAPIVEDFEDGTYNVVITPDAIPWTRGAGVIHSGSWAFRSGDPGDNQASVSSIAVPAGMTTMSFWYRVSSEAGFDTFWLIGDWGQPTQATLVGPISGEVAWTQATVDVGKFASVTLIYQKDVSDSSGADAAWVDDIEFTDTRLIGEVAWTPDRTFDFDPVSVRGDAWTAVSASGVLRRLGQGVQRLSALRRTILASNPIAYYPLEDGDAVDALSSALPGGTRMSLTRSGIEFGVNDDLPGSGPLPETVHLGTSRIADAIGVARVPNVPASAVVISWWSRIVNQAESAGSNQPFTSVRLLCAASGSTVTIGATHLFRQAEDEDWFTLNVSGVSTPWVELPATYDWHHIHVVVDVDSGNTRVRLYVDENLIYTATTATNPGSTSQLFFGMDADSANDQAISMGHIAVWGSADADYPIAAAYGWPGERAGARFSRICAEAGVPAVLVGSDDDTLPMGAQPVGTLPDLLAEIERTDGGLAYEPRGQLGVAYRTRTSLYNQAPVLTLDWAGKEIESFRPVLDDLLLRNDVTVSRSNGGSARVVREVGPNNVQSPMDNPEGVGRYDTDVAVNPASDDLLPLLAGWYLHLGTVSHLRWTQIAVDLDIHPELATVASAVSVGDLIRIVNTPPDISPDDIDLIVLGPGEQFRHGQPGRRLISFDHRPGAAYSVGAWETSRWEGWLTQLASAVDADDASWSVTVNPPWTTRAGAFPLDVVCEGERMTVTAISGTTSPQTWTVIRSVNGVVKAHQPGAPIRLWRPMRWAL